MQSTDKIYGDIEITEPVVLALIETPQMQRLKKIHQYGIYHYFYPEAGTTRFEHSLGVYWILNQFGASLEEQIAGLLHDISHGTFSHVMDHLYNRYEKEDYQESVNEKYFQTDISTVLRRFNIDPAVVEDIKRWPLAENNLPDICADRLQYTLADAVTANKTDQKKAMTIISDLTVKNNMIVFRDANIAKEFAELSLWMCGNFWHSNWGVYSYDMLKNILVMAMDAGILNKEDLDTDDDAVIMKLENCKNKDIVYATMRLKNLDRSKVIEDVDNYDYIHKKSKMRVIDPLIIIGDNMTRVSEIYPEFKMGFEQEKIRVNSPRYLKLID
ncbi:MAG: HD domain-containing protein [Patescibacteria group bacterium]